MNDETTLPNAEQAEAGGQQAADVPTEQVEAVEGEAKPEGENKPEEQKKEKTPEEREISRLRRRVDNLTKRLYQSAPAQERTPPLPAEKIERDNQDDASDSDSLTLSRAELDKLIDQEAAKRAPTIKQQADEIEHRRTVVQGLAKEWGQEKFDALASDLDDAFQGLADRSGKPKPATDAIFEADDPKVLIEYLADPDNAAEAEAIGRMNPLQAGRAVAKLEAKLVAKKADAKPQPSKAAAPIEPMRGGGMNNGMPNPADTKAWIRWRNEQERKGL